MRCLLTLFDWPRARELDRVGGTCKLAGDGVDGKCSTVAASILREHNFGKKKLIEYVRCVCYVYAH
jgi:hypothetical protein